MYHICIITVCAFTRARVCVCERACAHECVLDVTVKKSNEVL